MLHDTVHRVSENTADHVNERIRQATLASVRYFARHPEEIDRRIKRLDEEWDIERTLEANAAAFSLMGLALAHFVDRRWMALPSLVAAFLLQHALHGWCPPVPVLRRLGYRTPAEIDAERSALKCLRGDFTGVEEAEDRARAALDAAQG